MNTLEIRNSSQDGINVPEATLVPVSTTSDVIHLMNIGQKNRAVSATAMNDRSSRSHRFYFFSCLYETEFYYLFLLVSLCEKEKNLHLKKFGILDF